VHKWQHLRTGEWQLSAGLARGEITGGGAPLPPSPTVKRGHLAPAFNKSRIHFFLLETHSFWRGLHYPKFASSFSRANIWERA
jgi:hypothetical protein